MDNAEVVNETTAAASGDTSIHGDGTVTALDVDGIDSSEHEPSYIDLVPLQVDTDRDLDIDPAEVDMGCEQDMWPPKVDLGPSEVHLDRERDIRPLEVDMGPSDVSLDNEQDMGPPKLDMGPTEVNLDRDIGSPEVDMDPPELEGNMGSPKVDMSALGVNMDRDMGALEVDTERDDEQDSVELVLDLDPPTVDMDATGGSEVANDTGATQGDMDTESVDTFFLGPAAAIKRGRGRPRKTVSPWQPCSSTVAKSGTKKVAKQPKTVATTPEDVSTVFIVEKLMDVRTVCGNEEVFIKWKGFDETHNTWEPVANLNEISLKYLEILRQDVAKARAEAKDAAGRRRPRADPNVVYETLFEDPGKTFECILGVTKNSESELCFVLAFKTDEGGEDYDVIPAKIVNLKIPFQVIKFYEDRTRYAEKSAEED